MDVYGGHGMIDVSVPGYIGMLVAVAGLMTLPVTVSLYRERKILKRFAATPINPIDILISQIIVNFLMTLIGVVLLIVIGKTVFNLHFFGHIIPTLFAFVLTVLNIFSLGLLIAGVSSNVKAANAISYIVYFPMLFLSGAVMPLEIIPKSVANISKLLPLTYGVNLLKGAWMGEQLSTYFNDIIVLLVSFLVFMIIAIKAFKWE
jgi:ABC-2 type transport system permease protein